MMGLLMLFEMQHLHIKMVQDQHFCNIILWKILLKELNIQPWHLLMTTLPFGVEPINPVPLEQCLLCLLPTYLNQDIHINTWSSYSMHDFLS